MANFEKQTGRDTFFSNLDKELKQLIDPETGEVYRDLVKTIDCPLCESKKFRELFKKQGFKFVRCDDCGLVYVNPQIIEEKLLDYYTKETKDWTKVMLSPAQVEYNNKSYSRLLDVIGRQQPSGRLIDIGCSFGHFLDLARKRDYQVEGLELEDHAVSYAREEYDLKIHKKVIEECDFGDKKFDVATILGVLEHVVGPKEFLININKILSSNSCLGIVVPNVESLVCMVLKEQARAFTGRNHLTYFSIKTLKEMLKQAGFEIVFYETFVSGIDSIINSMQFLDPFTDACYDFLPDKFKDKLTEKTKKSELEKIIYKLDLGYKLRVLAKKVSDK